MSRGRDYATEVLPLAEGEWTEGAGRGVVERGAGSGLPQLPDVDVEHKVGEEVEELPLKREVGQ